MCVVVGSIADPPITIPTGHVMLDEMFCKLNKIKLTSRVRLGNVTSQLSPIGSVQIQPTHSLVSVYLFIQYN